MGSTDEQFCLRWNDFQDCIKSTFQDLRDENDFMDVTISCDGEQVKAHKVILSACSVTFKTLLKKNPAQHPVIVLWDVSPRDLAAILDFMYHGEVNVKQDHLNSFLAVAERLRVRGLCQNDKGGGSESKPLHQTKSFPEPSAKKQRISSPPRSSSTTTSLAHRSEDDDIEELPAPAVVKQEVAEHHPSPAPAQPQPPRQRPQPQQPQYSGASQAAAVPAAVDPTGGGYQLAEQDYDAGEDYADYSGYEDDMSGGAYMEGGVMMDQGQAKDGDAFCYFCNKEFKAMSSYRRHMRDYHYTMNESFPCDICQKVFRTKGQLINHKSEKHREIPANTLTPITFLEYQVEES